MSLSQLFQSYVNLATITIVILVVVLIIFTPILKKRDENNVIKIDLAMKDFEKLLTEKEFQLYKSNPKLYRNTFQLIIEPNGNLELNNDAYIDNLAALKDIIKNDISRKENEEKRRKKIREQLASNEEPSNPFME